MGRGPGERWCMKKHADNYIVLWSLASVKLENSVDPGELPYSETSNRSYIVCQDTHSGKVTYFSGELIK